MRGFLVAVALLVVLSATAMAGAPASGAGSSRVHWQTSNGVIGVINFTVGSVPAAVDSNGTNFTFDTAGGASALGNITFSDNDIVSNISSAWLVGFCRRYNTTRIVCDANSSVGISGGGSFWVAANFTNATYGIPSAINTVNVNITAFNATNQSTANTSAYLPVYFDNAVPTIANFSLLSNSSSLLTVGARNVTTTGSQVNITFNITDGNTGNLSAYNITYTLMANNTTVVCLANSSINAPITANLTGGTGSGCAFNTTNTAGGPVIMFVNVSDVAGNWRSYNLTSVIFVYGARPRIWLNQSTAAVANPEQVRFSQNRQNYSVPIPFFQGRPRGDDADSTLIVPFFTDRPMFMGPTVFENLVYNYTFNVTPGADLLTSNNKTVINITIFVPGMIPTVKSTFELTTPMGLARMTQYAPAFNGGFRGQANGSDLASVLQNQFTIFVGNYSSGFTELNASPSAGKLVNGSFATSMNGTITLELLVNRGEDYNVTLMLQSIPPINMSDQQIIGFNSTTAPRPGTATNVTFYVNLSGANQFYTPENMTLDFFIPLSVNFTHGGVNENFTVGANWSLEGWNYSGAYWSLMVNQSFTNQSNGDAPRARNFSYCFSNTFNASNEIGSGQNFTLCLGGVRYYLTNISNTQFVDFGLGTNVTLRFNATITIPEPPDDLERAPSGQPGSNVYEANVMMPVDGSLNISSDRLPNISSASNVQVYINNQRLSSGQFTLGSVEVTGTTVSQGSNSIKVTYSVPSASTGTSGGGGGGGGGGEGSVAAQPVTVDVGAVTAGEPYNIDIPREWVHSITDVTITPSESVSANVKVTVAPASLPSGAPAPSPVVYKYVDFTLTSISDTQIRGAEIRFQVDNKWLANNGVGVDEVVLYRYSSSNSWNDLQTTFSSKDALYSYFTASSPGFSTFAIGKKSPPGPPVVQPPVSPSPSAGQPPQAGQNVTGEKTPVGAAADNSFLIAAVVVILLVGIVYVLSRRKTSK